MKKSYLFVLALLIGCAASAPRDIELGEPVSQFESAKESKAVMSCLRREWTNMKWRTCSAAQPIVLDTEQGTDLYTQMVVDGSWTVISGIDHEQGSTISIHIDESMALGCDVQTPIERGIRRCR